MSDITVGVIGNPNCGKTTLFNALTGTKQKIGNWPGVTVDRKTGVYQHGRNRVEVVDTPGIYSLSAASVDEEVTRDYVLSNHADLIVNIVDASNIERNLYLTSQLMEMHVPMLVALNMMDTARDKKIEIDLDGLSKHLGCPVIPIVANKNQGIETLKETIARAANEKTVSAVREIYPAEIQAAVLKLLPLLADQVAIKNIDGRWLAVKLLEDDELAATFVGEDVLQQVAILQKKIEEQTGEEADIAIASAHYGFISRICSETVEKGLIANATVSDRIDSVLLSRFWGIPIFLAAMYLMFMFTINIGGAFIDFFDIFAGAVFVDGLSKFLEALHAPAWLVTVLASGVGGGIQTMATFIPPIGFMFLFLSFLEDSGYMARAAFVMDRCMRIIGLPGKSFIPMLVGFGCNVPAIMAARTLENERDRTLTIMMNPFMSCGARLPVYALFAAAFFPTGGQNLVFLLYLIGIAFAVLTGLVLKSTLLKGEITPFVMELPPYHLPLPKAIFLSAYDRLKSFMFKAGKVLIPVIALLAFLNSIGTDGTFGNEDSQNSALASISKSITPILRPIGVRDENWPATVGIFTGIFAKEAVVGTIDSLYSTMDAKETGVTDTEKFSFFGVIGESFATIPANLGEIAGTLLDPLGLSVGEFADTTAAAEKMDVNAATFGSMVTLFGSKVSAFAYLLFVLLYFPCSAAIAAVYRETNLKWTLFSGFWTTFLAYTASTFFYQTATFAKHPAGSTLWILCDIGMFVLVIVILKGLGSRDSKLGVLVDGASA